MLRLALVIVGGISVMQVAPAAPRTISKTMASADAQTFATAFAKAGQRAGFIIPNGETQGLLPPDSGEMLSVDEAVAHFTSRGRYKAMKFGGVTVLQHVRAPAELMNALESPRQHYPIKATFALAMYDIVLRGLARTRTGTLAGKEPGASAECPVEQTISIPAGTATPMQTLNALVSRVKGVAWMVRFGERGDPLRLQVGYVCGNGVWSALSVPGW